MTTHEILKLGNPILSKKADKVSSTEFGTPELYALINDLLETMGPTKGSGISALQIGVNKRVIVFGYEKLKNYPDAPPVPLTVLINPEYEAISGTDTIEAWEHCLSMPGFRGVTHRYNKIKYWGYTPEGDFIEKLADGIHAILVQHEIDHLDGLCFLSKIPDFSCFGFINEFEKNHVPLSLKILTT